MTCLMRRGATAFCFFVEMLWGRKQGFWGHWAHPSGASRLALVRSACFPRAALDIHDLGTCSADMTVSFFLVFAHFGLHKNLVVPSNTISCTFHDTRMRLVCARFSILSRQNCWRLLLSINMLAAIQYLLLVRLLANALRVTGAFRLSPRVRTHLCRTFVIEPRALATALRLVEKQGAETRLWDRFLQRVGDGCVVCAMRSRGVACPLLIGTFCVFHWPRIASLSTGTLRRQRSHGR